VRGVWRVGVGVGAMAALAAVTASVTESRTTLWYDVVMRGGACVSKSKSYKVVMICDISFGYASVPSLSYPTNPEKVCSAVRTDIDKKSETCR